MVAPAVQTLLDRIAEADAERAPFRATVTAVDGHLVQIQRDGESAGTAEQYPSLSRYVLNVGDVVLCLPLGGKPVVLDVIQRAHAASPTIAANANAGTTGAATISGRDDAMQIQVIPGGTGIAAGVQCTVTFAAPMATSSYLVLVTPNSSAARTLGGVVGPISRGTTSFDFDSNAALTSGSTYQWLIFTKQYQ